MPSTPNNTGSKSTAPSSKTKVRKKDINADTFPSFRAVKKAELKIAIPEKKYEGDALDYIKRAIEEAEYYVGGEHIEIKGGDAKSKLDQALEYLVTHVVYLDTYDDM